MVAVGELADRYVEEMAALDPCAAAEMGVAGHDAELTDYGPDGVASRAALLRGTLSQLGPAPEATAAEPFEVTVMRERLGAELALYDAGLRLGEVNVLDGSLEQLRLVFDLMDTGSEAAWENLAARLRRLPAALDRHREGILRAAADGHVAALRQVERSADQCALWTGSFSELPADYGDGPLRQELEPDRSQRRRGRSGTVRAVGGLLHRRTPGPGRDLRLGLGRAWTHPRRAGRGRRAAGAGRVAGRGRRTAQPRSRLPGHRRGPVPRLDAGAGRPHPRRARRRPLRRAGGASPAGVPHQPARQRRGVLHPPVGGLLQTGPRLVERAGRDGGVLDLAGGHHHLPRGRARPSPPARPHGLPGGPAQSLPAAGLQGRRPQ